MKRLMLLGIAVCLICTGCATLKEWFGFNTQTEQMLAQELAWDGMENYREGEFRKALAAFEKLRDWYPFSKYAILAELKIADCNYKLRNYEDAIVAYTDFEKLHPRNEAIPYVVYQIGRCYFDRLDTADRDQSNARKAMEVFARLKQQFPRDSHAQKADEHIRLCIKSMAEAEFLVGLFYYNTKHYKGALHRFKNLLAKYPDMGVHQKALNYIVLCEATLKAQAAENQ